MRIISSFPTCPTPQDLIAYETIVSDPSATPSQLEALEKTLREHITQGEFDQNLQIRVSRIFDRVQARIRALETY